MFELPPPKRGFHLLSFAFSEWHPKPNALPDQITVWSGSGPYIALWRSDMDLRRNQEYVIVRYASGAPNTEEEELFRSDESNAQLRAAEAWKNLRPEYPYEPGHWREEDKLKDEQRTWGGYRPGAGKPRREGEYKQVEIRTDLIEKARRFAGSDKNAREAIEIVLRSALQS